MSRYCNGTQIPKAETISQIADYFDVSVDALLGRSSSSPIREPKTRSSKIDYQIRQYLDDPGNMIALLLERVIIRRTRRNLVTCIPNSCFKGYRRKRKCS